MSRKNDRSFSGDNGLENSACDSFSGHFRSIVEFDLAVFFGGSKETGVSQADTTGTDNSNMNAIVLPFNAHCI